MTAMSKRVKSLAAVLAVAVTVAGCAVERPAEQIRQQYALEEVVGQGDVMQKIYRVAARPVPEVAREIADANPPQEMSTESGERMFLVYRDTVVHVQQDPDRPEDTLVEVDTHEFVRQNYDPSFLHGFLAASIITSMFGGGWQNRAYNRHYYGFGDYKYRNPTDYRTPPSFRNGAGGGNVGRAVRPPTSKRGTGRIIRKRR